MSFFWFVLIAQEMLSYAKGKTIAVGLRCNIAHTGSKRRSNAQLMDDCRFRDAD